MAPLDAVFDLSIRGCGQAIGGARARREVTATSQTQRRPPPMGLLLRRRAPCSICPIGRRRIQANPAVLLRCIEPRRCHLSGLALDPQSIK